MHDLNSWKRSPNCWKLIHAQNTWGPKRDDTTKLPYLPPQGLHVITVTTVEHFVLGREGTGHGVHQWRVFLQEEGWEMDLELFCGDLPSQKKTTFPVPQEKRWKKKKRKKETSHVSLQGTLKTQIHDYFTTSKHQFTKCQQQFELVRYFWKDVRISLKQWRKIPTQPISCVDLSKIRRMRFQTQRDSVPVKNGVSIISKEQAQ